jgi:iron complex outermembrane receptor protein
VAANELPTDGYTLVNLRLTHRLHQQDARRVELFLRASNLLDQEVRFHTSVLKDLAPLGGRSVMVGVNGSF